MSLAQLVTRLIDGFYIRPVAAVVPLQTFRYACCGGLNMVLDALWYALIYNFVVASTNEAMAKYMRCLYSKEEAEAAGIGSIYNYAW